MKKSPILVPALLALILALSGCTRNRKPEATPYTVIAVSGITDTGLALAAAIAAPDWVILPCEDDGEALQAVIQGKADHALIRSDRLHRFLSDSRFAPEIRSGCRGLGTVALTPVLLIAQDPSSRGSLKGRHINTGVRGEDQDRAARGILKGLGLDIRKDYQPEGLTQAAALRALTEGKLDALIWMGEEDPPPYPLLKRFRPLSFPETDNPYYRAVPWAVPVTIRLYQNDLLPTVPVIRTIGIPWILLTEVGTDPLAAYRITRRLNREQPAEGWVAPLLPADRTAGQRTLVPLHPGSTRYFSLSAGTLE